MTDTETFCPGSRTEWRQWLKKNHRSRQSVWLICYTKKSELPTVSWSEAVEEALCFGWIDSVRKTIDEFSFMQFYSRRKPRSTWSKINKDKTGWLIKRRLMAKAGYESIETAKQNGSWTILDEVEKLLLPDDLETALKRHKRTREYFMNLSKSVRKEMLGRLVLTKRPETRQKRIAEIVENLICRQSPKT